MRESAGSIRARIARSIVREGHVRSLETNWIKNDGEYLTVRETARSVKDATEVLFYEGIVEDITSEKKAEMFDRGCRQILEMVARNEPLNDVLARIAALLESQAPGRTCSIALRRGDRLYPIPSSKVGASSSQSACPCEKASAVARMQWSQANDRRSERRESAIFSNVHEVFGLLGIQGAWSTPICPDGEVTRDDRHVPQ